MKYLLQEVHKRSWGDSLVSKVFAVHVCEDLTSIPSIHAESQIWWHAFVILLLKRPETGGTLGLPWQLA